MNRDDLLAHLIVSTAGWLKQPANSQEHSRAWDLHCQLKRLAGIDSQHRLSGVLSMKDRSALFKAINTAANSVVQSAIDALAIAQSNGLEFVELYEDSEGKKITHRFNINTYVPLYLIQDMLIVRSKLRGVSPREQFQVMRTFSVWWNWWYSDIQTRCDTSYMRPDDVAEILLDEQVANLKLTEFKSKLSATALAAFDTITDPRPEYENAVMFVDVAPSFKSDELNEIGSAYLNISSEMSLPFTLSRRMSREARASCRQALDIFHDCGVCLGVLGSWIRTLSITESARTCKICYRHLGRKEVKFCSHHSHTSNKRQDAEAGHVARDFEPRWRNFFSNSKAELEYFLAQSTSDRMANSEYESAARGMVRSELVPATAELMFILRNLEGLISPVIDDLIKVHFRRFLECAQRPFEITVDGNMHESERAEVYRQRKLSARWLNANNFFATFFGQAGKVSNRSSDFSVRSDLLWLMQDVNHPLALGNLRSLASLAQDLAKLRCWVESEQYVRKHAYLDVDEARDLLATTDARGRRTSITKVAKTLGASKQALSHALKSQKPRGKERILKKFLSELPK